jgi:hypothetical protein
LIQTNRAIRSTSSLLLPLKIFGLQSTWHLCHSSVSSCPKKTFKPTTGNEAFTDCVSNKTTSGIGSTSRQIENYVPQESTSKPHISKAVTGQSEFDEIKGMIQQLGTRMDSFESKRPEQQSYRPTHQPHQSWKPTCCIIPLISSNSD